jgi:hypothetical protein
MSIILFTNCYIKTNSMPCTLFLLLFHFTPTCFDVRNVIFRECTRSFIHLLACLMCCFGAFPEGEVPYVETCRSEVKKQ